MIIPHLPKESRVWFFGASRILDNVEVDLLKSDLDALTSNWKSHGAAISAGFEILHESIVIVAVDQSVESPSGCSIDKVFNLMKSNDIDFFNRNLIWRPYCNTTEIHTIESFKNAFQNGEIMEDSLVINSLVENLGQARDHLYVPLIKHWAFNKIVK